MNQVTLWLQTLRGRVLFTIFLLVTVFLISTGISYANPLAAQAKPLTQEVLSYQVARTDGENAQDTAPKPNNDLIENSREKLKSRADDVREKLNLDQPIYPGTKEVLDSAQDRAKEAVKGTQQALEKATNTITGNQ
jgi:predicted PurR-regulated permease PerM